MSHNKANVYLILQARKREEEAEPSESDVLSALSSNGLCEEDNAEFIGLTADVLVEGPSKMALKQMKQQPAVTPHPVPGVELSEDAAAEVVSLETPGSAGTDVTPDPVSGPIQLVGRTDCDRIVVFDGNPRLAGSLATISVDDCTATTLIGRIVTREVQHAAVVELPVV